ncbi:MAG: hypothetical protein IJ274_03160, partial [Lachnospiraceae bacterium]|nr:hypothetical protein [Lachnospiraceae bacterium]
MTKKTNWRKLGLILTTVAVLIFMFRVLSAIEHTGREQDIIPLKQGWTIWLNEQKYENQTLSDFDMPRGLEKGDKI